MPPPLDFSVWTLFELFLGLLDFVHHSVPRSRLIVDRISKYFLNSFKVKKYEVCRPMKVFNANHEAVRQGALAITNFVRASSTSTPTDYQDNSLS